MKEKHYFIILLTSGIRVSPQFPSFFVKNIHFVAPTLALHFRKKHAMKCAKEMERSIVWKYQIKFITLKYTLAHHIQYQNTNQSYSVIALWTPAYVENFPQFLGGQASKNYFSSSVSIVVLTSIKCLTFKSFGCQVNTKAIPISGGGGGDFWPFRAYYCSVLRDHSWCTCGTICYVGNITWVSGVQG